MYIMLPTDKHFHFYGANVRRLCVISHFLRGVNNVFALLRRNAALVDSYLPTFRDSQFFLYFKVQAVQAECRDCLVKYGSGF